TMASRNPHHPPGAPATVPRERQDPRPVPETPQSTLQRKESMWRETKRPAHHVASPNGVELTMPDPASVTIPPSLDALLSELVKRAAAQAGYEPKDQR
ncbi:MAG: hypothetical protein ACR2MB_05435, partial [Acidimicrobiales bacterium]